MKVEGLCPLNRGFVAKLTRGQKGKIGSGTKTKTNPVKSYETYVQILYCHIGPFYII